MATPIASPRARALGAALRAARESRDIGLRELSRIEGISHAMLSLWEKGTRLPKVKEVAAILGCLSIIGEERDRILELAEHAHEPDWLEKVMPDVPPMLSSFIEYERTATSMFCWQPMLVPGLLQTGDYARTILSQGNKNKDAVDQRLMIRMMRRDVLDGPQASQCTFLLGEAALRQALGGTATMIAQLRHVLAMSERPM